MADQTITASEEMVGSGHATKNDTLNRQVLVEHNADGTHVNPIAKNAIINGDLNIWQAGTSFAAIANADYFADMWRYVKVGTMVHTITRDTDVPTQAESGHKSNYSLKVDCTTADAAMAVGDLCTLASRIEGYNFAPFVGKTATLSFWVKATKTGIYCVAFMSSGSDMGYTVEYTVNVSDTWEKKTITLDFDYVGGTWDYVNGTGLSIIWVLTCGSDYHVAAETWTATNDLATINQVNACDDTANNFWLSQVQLELGDVATKFEYRTFNQELALCQRYFCKSYDYNVNPGTVDNDGQFLYYISGVANADHAIHFPIRFPVSMRAQSTIILYDAAGTSGKVSMASGNGIAGTAGNIGFDGIRSVSGTNGAVSTTRQIFFHYTAAARL